MRGEDQKSRVRECLGRYQLDEMEVSWRELEPQSHQSTPEERLNDLLDSSREYCSEEEFGQARAEALSILARSGFRDARDFAVKLHSEWRRRAKDLEESEEKEAQKRDRGGRRAS
ncbi:MAG TPA: hypothetical protein VI685_10730 [Candidatus Angelobacter sp.]